MNLVRIFHFRHVSVKDELVGFFFFVLFINRKIPNINMVQLLLFHGSMQLEVFPYF